MTGFTPEEWRTAARVARRSIFTEGNPDLADAWDKAADQAEARLIPAGGIALTAEQVEDVRIVLGLNGSQDIKVVLDAQARLRALFPATEPAPYCSKSVCSANEGHDGTCAEASGWAHDAYEDDTPATEPAEEVKPIGWYRAMTRKFATAHFGFPEVTGLFERTHTASDGGVWGYCGGEWELREYPPAPAEPAEEETKAEYPHRGLGDLTVLGPEIFTNGDVINWRGENFVRQPDPASSPVAPAPTETGPWQDISEAPKHLTLIDRVGDKWTYDGDNWITPETAILPVLYINRKFAPFVAAEEG